MFNILDIKDSCFLDTTPLAFAVTGLIGAWALFRYKLFELLPLALSTVNDRMADGVIILEDQG
jgi:hypothetical protein